MKRGFLRSTLGWALVALMGCTAGGGGCGGCTEPIPGGFPRELRVQNAISAKVSRQGLDFFESRVDDIIGAVLAGGLDFQVPCVDITQKLNYELLGYTLIDTELPIFACDHNSNNSCSDESSGSVSPLPNDPNAPMVPPLKSCQAKASVRKLRITPRQATPTSPVEVDVTLEIRVNTGAILFNVDTSGIWGLGGLCGKITCAGEFDSNLQAPENVPINATLRLTLDADEGDMLGFELVGVNISDFIDTDELQIYSVSDSTDCSLLCDAANFDMVKELVFNLMKGTIETQLQNAIDSFRCRACEPLTNNCPGGDNPSSCATDLGICYRDRAARSCPPSRLGLEGRVKAGDFLAGFGGSTSSLLDLYALIGGRNPDQSTATKAENGGIVVGIMGGTRSAVRDTEGNVVAPGVATCVPARSFAARPQPTVVNYDAEALAAGSAAAGYHLGLGLSDNFLDRALFDAYQSGLLCLNIDSSVTSFLSSSLFGTFLPSLSVLTQGRDVPMTIALRPKNAPHIIVGKGTTRVVNGETVPDDPLLTVVMEQVQIDFYALLENRHVRLFSLRTDIRLPLSLEFNAALNTVKPVLANLETAVSNINAQNSEMLAENPQIVADLLDAVIGLVQPVLASALAPIELPSFSGFRLNIQDARGVVPYAGSPGYEHLALFAKLDIQAQPYTAASDTWAELVGAELPNDAEALRAGSRPKAFIDVGASGLTPIDFRGWEYSWRVNGGLWSPWTTKSRLEISAPVMMLQGRHLVEVRSREIGVSESEDLSPASVVVDVDYVAPKVELRLDPSTRQVLTEASDEVSRVDELLYSYRVSGGGWTSFGPAQAFSLDELGANPSLEVQVVDAAGLVGKAWFGEPASQLEDAKGSGLSSAASGMGCTSVGGSLLSLGALIFALRRRRRS